MLLCIDTHLLVSCSMQPLNALHDSGGSGKNAVARQALDYLLTSQKCKVLLSSWAFTSCSQRCSWVGCECAVSFKLQAGQYVHEV